MDARTLGERRQLILRLLTRKRRGNAIAKFAGQADAANYRRRRHRFPHRGYRDHSDATRDIANASCD